MKTYSRFDVVLAVCASALVSGLGQLFELKYRCAAMFFFGAVAGYMFYPPVGYLVHAIAVVEAFFPNFEYKNSNQKYCKRSKFC